MTVTRIYQRAFTFFREDIATMVLSAVLILFSTLAAMLQPFPLAILIRSVLGGQVPDHWVYRLFHAVAPEDKRSQILALAGTTLVLRLLQESLQVWQGALKVRVSYNGLSRARCALFRQLQRLSLSYHRTHTQGDAINRIVHNTTGIQQAFNLMQGAFVNVATLLIIAVIMFGMNVRLALVALSIIPLLVWVIRSYGQSMTDQSRRAAAADAALTTGAQQSVALVSLVQSYGREEQEYKGFVGLVNRAADAWTAVYWQELKYWLSIGAIFGVGSTIILAYGGTLALSRAVPIEFLIVFMQFLWLLYDPLNKLSTSGSAFRQGAAGIERVLEVLDLEPTIRDAPEAVDLPLRPRTVELDRVSFEYRPGEAVLRDVTATIEPGEMVAFVGPSGAGKSTILNLLPRFYDPVQGSVRFDGHDLRAVKLKDARAHVALVLQESLILPTSVAENIAYGRPDASPADVRRAAELAGAHAFIEKMPEGYRTVLSESGQNLSGGQRQRIAIARALCSEAPVIVLDEPTSALDPQNEQMVTETLHALKGKRTMVIVSHRLSTVAECDRIYVMEEGRIVEQGTHESMLERRGTYYRMARHQMKLSDSGAPA
jgi:ATP-binding cassette subfamily B protein